jgi:PAS domain S-box-containing protein
MTETGQLSQQLTILIADDDRRVLEAFARNLNHAGYQVLTATGGEEALEIYHATQPDITLLDIRMPQMDGLMVLHAIREKAPEAEVVLTTGHGDEDLVIAALRANASDFISKPIDQMTLEAVLRRSRERIRLRKELHTAREALRASEERYRRIVETVPDVITTIDREGTILFINQPIGGVIEEDLVGESVRDFLTPVDQKTAMGEIERVFETGETGSFRIKGVQTDAWYENRIGPVWQDGKVVAATIISTNINRQVEREQGLEAACEALADRLEQLALTKARELNETHRHTIADIAPKSTMETSQVDETNEADVV